MITLTESILKSTKTGQFSKEIDGYHVGDIVVSVFQYASRHVHFYEITSLQGKATVVVKELKKQNVDDDGYGQNGTCIPVLGEYATNKEIKNRVGKRGLRINDTYTYKWDGKPEMFYTD